MLFALVLPELFDEASFSSEVRAVLASVVFPDCRAVLRVFSNDSMLEADEVASVDEVLLPEELSENDWLCICCASLAIAESDSSLLMAQSLLLSRWLNKLSLDAPPTVEPPACDI